MFFVQINHTGKGFLFLIFREIKLRKYSSLHKLFYGLKLTVGTASVLIGVLFLTSWNTNNVYADSRNVTSGESIAKNNNPQEGNPAVNKDNVQIVDNDSTEVSNISDSKSSKVIKSDATKSDIVRDKTTIDDNGGTKVPELTVQANNKQALTTVTEDNGAKVSKTEKYNNSDIKNQSKNSEKTQETTLVKKVLEKKVLDKEKLSSESLIDQKKLDGKVEIPATDPSNTITATDPSNYPKLNGLIDEDKYIYQVLSLEPEYWDSRSKLILSVNRNDPNDKNIYAYVIHGNYNYYDGNYDYNSVEKSITIGKDKSSIITIDGRKYRLNNNGSSEVSINGKTVSTQNSSTVTSKPRYLDNLPISQDYGLGNTSNDNCSAIGEIVPVFTKNSVIKYYYSDNEGHLQEFKNSELPNVSVEGFTGQEFEIDDVDQYKKVIPGYHLKSAPTGNFKGTLSQFSDDKYYKKVYYDFGTNKVKYSVLYHQIYPDGTMEVWLVDGKGDALTETREIAPNTSTEFSNYNCTVRNPYVTAVQHEVQFIYSPDKQHMTITYVDDTTGKTLHTDKRDGFSDQDANYTTSDTIKQYEDQHYKLVSDTTKGQDLIFDHDDDADQTYEVHFVHGEHAIDQTISPKQTIHYVYANGLARQGKAADDNVQQLSFKRDGYNDEVTGIDHWNAWTPANSQYEAVDSPVIQGYTPDKLVVEKSTVNPTDKDIEVTVTYNADKQAAHVIYIDKTTNTTLASKDLSGNSDKDSGYNTKDKIGEYKSQHYVLAGDETNGKNVIFDHNDKQDQTYYVYFVHDTQKVSRQDTVTSTIDYKFEDGKTAQPTVTQTKHFSEGGVKDLVTGKIAWDEAKPQKFDDVTTPAISGYTPDKDKVAGSTVKFGDKDIEVTVTYHNNAQKASVTYIDDKTGKTLKVDNLNGVTNAKSGYTTKAAIDTYTGLGYTLVSDDTNGKEVVFDNDDAVDQAFTVHLSHGTITITPENPGKPGEPVDPDNPDGPKYPDGTDEYQVKRTGTQTIHYVGAGDKTPADNKQTFVFTREITFDDVTGKIISVTPWNVQSHTFGKVDTPVIPGYHADKAVAGGATVTPDDLNKVIIVTYAPDGGSGDNPGSNGGGDQGTTPIPEPTPDDQPDTKLPSDNNTDKDVEKDKQDKPEKVKKARKIIKTRITKQEHIGNAEKAEPLAEQEHNDQTVASPVKNEANEPQLPQTGEANTSVIGLLGILVAGFAAILGFESSRSRKHKN